MKKIVTIMVVGIISIVFLGSFQASTYDIEKFNETNIEAITAQMLEENLKRNTFPIRTRLLTGIMLDYDTPETTTNPETSSPSEDDVNTMTGVSNIKIELIEDVDETKEITYEGFDPNVDYSQIIIDNMLLGNIEEVKAAIDSRNLKIESLGYEYITFTFEELNDLARIIQQEAGSSWLSMEWKMGVGEVVLNRVASPEFANSIHDVITSVGQYGHSASELSNPYAYFYTFNLYETCIEAALRLFNNERVFDDPSVVFQSQSVQGGGICRIMQDYTGSYTPTYFCYSNNSSLY